MHVKHELEMCLKQSPATLCALQGKRRTLLWLGSFRGLLGVEMRSWLKTSRSEYLNQRSITPVSKH
jgi:hypothetical protein